MRQFKNILLVLSTGYIFVYFSELLFWARPRGPATEWIAVWLAYSLMAYIFLALVQRFRVRSMWALFLAGAAFGWLAEGVVVQTTYEMLPLSISWTGLAWHGLITVLVGWYGVQRSFQASRPASAIGLSAALGLAAGLWAIMWWLEPGPDGGVSAPAEYAAYMLVCTLLALAAYWLLNWSATERFAPNRWLTLAVCALFVLYFVVTALPAAPIAALVLPALLGLVYLGLRWNASAEAEGSLLDTLGARIPRRRFAALLALPLVSVLVYTAAYYAGLRAPTNWVVYALTTPLGFIFFGLSLYKVWRAGRRSAGGLGGVTDGVAGLSE